MNKKLKGFKPEHADVMNAVAESTNKAAKAFNKLGKQFNKAKHYKEVVCASEMESTTLYKGVNDGKLYRRLKGKSVETMVDSNWVEAKVNFDFLNNENFKRY